MSPRLACSHPVCDPGSAECRAKDVPPEMHPTMRDLARLSDVLGNRPLYVDVPAEVEGVVLEPNLYRQIVDDARQQLANARGQDQLFGGRDRASQINGMGQREAQWRGANPGLSRLTDLDTNPDPLPL